MLIKQTKKPTIAKSEFSDFNTLILQTNKAKNKQLVAKWLVDENSRLYCKWITKD